MSSKQTGFAGKRDKKFKKYGCIAASAGNRKCAGSLLPAHGKTENRNQRK